MQRRDNGYLLQWTVTVTGHDSTGDKSYVWDGTGDKAAFEISGRQVETVTVHISF